MNKTFLKWGQRLIIPILSFILLFTLNTTKTLDDRNRSLQQQNINLESLNEELEKTVDKLIEQIKKAYEPLPIEVTIKNEVILLGKSTSTVLLPDKPVIYEPAVISGGEFMKASYDIYGIVSQEPVEWDGVDSLLALAHQKKDEGYPQIYNHLWRSGQQLDRMYRGLSYELYPMSAIYAAAAEIVYYGFCWDDALYYYAPRYTPWAGLGECVVRELLPYGLSWEFALAALYAESEWGCNIGAVAFGNAPTIPTYIALVLTYPAPNDVDSFVNEWHMPANIETFRFNFGNVVTWLKGWRP